MWFEKLTGFQERSADYVRDNLEVEGDTFISKANDQKFTFGHLEIPTLQELKAQCPPIETYNDKIKVEELVADVRDLHCQIENKNALFQAASQFNLLEMIDPSISPENGIDRYENDYTQGPACAIACGSGTIYRNYFVPVGDQIGQTRSNQIDCLDLIGQELKNDEFKYWSMRNGYALFDEKGLFALNKKIASLNSTEREALKQKLKTGIQWNTEVTISKSKHRVSQIYCSALPVAYCATDQIYWEYFSRIILEATYESTLYAALINLEKYNSNKVFLTLVGGGAFGNAEYWILESMRDAIRKFRYTPLDIKIVSYGHSNDNLIEYLKDL